MNADRPPEVLKTAAKRLRDSGLLDEAAYCAAAGIDQSTDAARHYLLTGWHTGLEPGPEFDGSFLAPYFRNAGYRDPPALIYLDLRAAGYPVYATRAAAEECAATIRTSDLFDAADYAVRSGGLDGLDPSLHYVIVGERLGIAPCNSFDPVYYRERNPDVAKASVNCFAHYLESGRDEGRRPVSIAATLHFDGSRILPERETVLLIVHQASRTGAPILAYNVGLRLRQRYNIVAVLLAGGALVGDFEDSCAAKVGPLSYIDWHPVEARHLVKRLAEVYRPLYAIANSIECRLVLPPLALEHLAVVTLVNEFASYTRPKGAMGQALDWSTQVVFSAAIAADSALAEHPTLSGRPVHILAQGRCDLPPQPDELAHEDDTQRLRQALQPQGAEAAFGVIGCGTVQFRKGVDLFLSCAAAVAALKPKRAVRFVWIGQGFDPDDDIAYSCYLADQITRSGLDGKVAIIDEVADLEPVYALADVFFLSSRLDPMPNVAIDAAFHGLPVVCFEHSGGIADFLGASAVTKPCVAPYLDVATAARIIAALADDEAGRNDIAEATRSLAQATFDMDRYVARLDELGRDAVRMMSQRAADFVTIRDDPLFDQGMYLPPEWPPATREEAIDGFLARWNAVATSASPASNGLFRRPCAGFHPQLYAHDNADRCDFAVVNPLAHFIRSGKPDGPWRSEVITPQSNPKPTAASAPARTPRVGLHGHFFYPDLAADLLARLKRNRSGCDLILTTDSEAKAETLRETTAGYRGGEVSIRIVPNRGRDIGAFLTELAGDIESRFDIIGHVHGKRSAAVGDALGNRWREFLWQNLIGERHAMMDVILDRFAADDSLGIVFPEDTHLSDWDADRALAEQLAARMQLREPLPPFFNFPVGTMFWARTRALAPLFALKLGWDDYPQEPVPIDGTILHALERLLPFAARQSGYRYATTHIAGLNW